MTITDVHTHHLQATGAVISVMPADFHPQPGLLYSVGLHPWHTADADAAEQLQLLEQVATHPQVVAIGETGLDALRGVPLERQEQLMLRHISLAERLGKPLILHMVRTSQQVLRLWRQSARRVPWVIHGMRGNANVARPLLQAGFYLSFGARFNPATVLATPPHQLLLETDDAAITISQVAQAVAAVLQVSPEALLHQATQNATRLLRNAADENDNTVTH